MSKSDKSPLENAVEIIDKFGGIRPMASKTGVAVTTIQGWKKRGVIPAARRDSILEAAEEHGIDLAGVVEGASSPDVQEYDVPEDEAVEEIREEESSDENDEDSNDDNVSQDKEEDDDLEIPPALKRTAQAESARKAAGTLVAEGGPKKKDYTEFTIEEKQGAMTRSVVIAVIIVLLILAALAGLVMPKYKNIEHRNSRVEDLEKKLAVLDAEPSGFKGLVPENWSEELEQLKRQAAQVKKDMGEKVSKTVSDVGEMSHDIASAEGISTRVEQLQSYVSEISGESGVYALKKRFEGMRQDYAGSKTLDNSVKSLLVIVQKVQHKTGENTGVDAEVLNDMVAAAGEEDPSLRTCFDGVPKKELKAAVALLAMTQVRDALGRDDADFDEDLELLQKMVGDEDPELNAAIDKLAPYSREGVLTPAGVKKEFQQVAGDAVAASLRGEDVSVSDKLSAKFNELLKVEKDGELLTGTETQATINKAENLVEENNFAEAINVLKGNLGTKELQPLQPWIKKAEGLIASKNLNEMLEEAIEMNFGSGLLGGKVLEKHGKNEH